MTQQPGSDGSWGAWRRGDHQASGAAHPQYPQAPQAEEQPPGSPHGAPPQPQAPYPGAPHQGTAQGAPGYQQPGYAPGQPQGYPGADYYQQTAAWHQNTATISQGQSHATNALICGILGLFFIGIILGPIAIVQAKKATRLGADASAGMILGWIATILSGAVFLFFALMILLAIIGAAAGA